MAAGLPLSDPIAATSPCRGSSPDNAAPRDEQGVELSAAAAAARVGEMEAPREAKLGLPISHWEELVGEGGRRWGCEAASRAALPARILATLRVSKSGSPALLVSLQQLLGMGPRALVVRPGSRSAVGACACSAAVMTAAESSVARACVCSEAVPVSACPPVPAAVLTASGTAYGSTVASECTALAGVCSAAAAAVAVVVDTASCARAGPEERKAASPEERRAAGAEERKASSSEGGAPSVSDSTGERGARSLSGGDEGACSAVMQAQDGVAEGADGSVEVDAVGRGPTTTR